MATDHLPDWRQRSKRRAKKVGLVYVNHFDRGITRRRCGRGFTYVTATGKTVTSKRTRQRIESLVIPPAWQDVWICPQSTGHIQAVGRDEEGRKQYIYHSKWQAVSSATKYDRMHLMAELLPRVRRRVRRDLSDRGLGERRVLAAVVRLVDMAHLRVGNEHYAKRYGSHGATTLDAEHVHVDRFTVSLEFPGKSGRRRAISFTDKKVAQVIRRCEEISGQHLFCYHGDDGHDHPIESTHVNDYLRSVTGESITAKDFRTWWGSVIALASLTEASETDTARARKKAVTAAVGATAEALGNTKAVCRSSYIHPGILAAGESGELTGLIAKAERHGHGRRRELTVDENRFADLLPYLEFS